MKPAHTPCKAVLSFIAAAALAIPGFSRAADPNYWSWAQTPPMGWNSWDCFGAGVWQTDVLANADYMDKNLKAHGWDLITVDIQWYEPLAHTTEYRKGAVLETDANGRLLPAPNRFPLTAETHSFKPIADYLHAHGLKFGLHLMRGIPRQAVDRDNALILGTGYHAADIADKVNVCRWNGDMYGVDMTKPGAQQYYDSVFAQLASWDLDFVKVDDLAGREPEIEAVRQAIDKTGRRIVFSVSPGPSPLGRGTFVSTNANMWRISDDFWDSWGALYAQFARVNNWTPFRAAGHWPDADMIPFGNVRAWQTTGNWTHFTHDEQFTLITLWCIGRSPLILGGNLPKNDEFTLSLLTNDEVLAVNQNSTNNKQLFNTNNQVAWVADVPGSKDKYLAVFNTSPAPQSRNRRDQPPTVQPADKSQDTAMLPVKISVSLADLEFTGSVKVRDLWNHKDLDPMTGEFAPIIHSHGAALYRLSLTK
jgi:alpha-galactosidase